MADISKITLPTGDSYDIKDTKAREDILTIKTSLGGGIHYIGVTTTQLADDSDTATIQINDDSVTAKQGDLVIYEKLEFIYDGTKWHEFGSTGSLKGLAFKDTATGDYTPTGSVSAPTFNGISGEVSVTGIPSGTIEISTNPDSDIVNYTPTGTISVPTTTVELGTTTVSNITNVGSLPSCTFPEYTVKNETLTISEGSFDSGALPTKDNVTVATSIKSAKTTAPNFKGTGIELKAIFNGTETASTGEFTPEGTITKPNFTGTEGKVIVS